MKKRRFVAWRALSSAPFDSDTPCSSFSQFLFLRDIETNESSEILSSDIIAEVENDPRSEMDLKSFELPVIDMPASPVFSRTGSQIIRRQSARFDSFTSDSFRRNSGSVQVIIFCNVALY